MAPPDLYDHVTRILPDFEAYCRSSNLFREDDGSYTHYGLFVELSHFVRERFESLPSTALSALGSLMDECLASPDKALSNAAATCFLENLIGEPFMQALLGYLGLRGSKCIRELQGDSA